ncbi:LLM class flavin-dependent oxidoreductase [Methylocapsa sp. S129]|uniref:LLM class flavin-dependent oxidoreductase n=1 Tax=Methylocapsa sp. S129 TaxID=1641869 RepID=UPI00131B7DAB|nr:LLM class flavin-dependent oxidoreductase [Methylocapsa sp. S129]
MRFGLFNLMNQLHIDQKEVFGGTIDSVKLADQMGFDVAWFAEHHFANYSLCPSPLMMAGAVARETKNIKVGPAVIVAPLYNPIRVAEEVALLDQLSEGRAVLGMGCGYQRFEFEAFGADLSERQERMLEIWRIIDQAVHQNRFSFTGDKYQLPDVTQAIRLYRPRRLDTFFVAWTPEIIKHAIAVDAVPFCSVGWGNSAALKALYDRVAEEYATAGADLRTRRFAAQRFVYVTDDRDELRKAAEGIRYVGRCGGHMRVGAQVMEGHIIADRPLNGEPTLEAIIEGVPIGSPEVVAERIVGEIRSIGITDFSCFMWPAGIPARSALRSMERFGSEVLPLVNKALAVSGTEAARHVA